MKKRFLRALLTQHGEIFTFFRHDIHFNPAVCHWLMIDIQLIIYEYIYFFICHFNFHIAGIDSHQHLTIWSALISKVFLISLKNHMRVGHACFHNLQAVRTGDFYFIFNRSRHTFQHFIIEDIVLSLIHI